MMPNQNLLDVADAVEKRVKKITEAIERLREMANAGDMTNVMGALVEIGGNGNLIATMARRAAIGPPPSSRK